ncbi:MAG: hypothetical protein ACLUFV_01115 [Acutalibacteraceae bacterium]
MIKDLRRSAVMRDPSMAAATLVGAQAEGARAPRQRERRYDGLYGPGMAQQAGGMNAQDLFRMGAQQQQAKAQPADGWVCPKCGAQSAGKFCAECGEKRPEDPFGWRCACGAFNKGKFCPECGAKKPADAKVYKCDKCGWEPEDNQPAVLPRVRRPIRRKRYAVRIRSKRPVPFARGGFL